MSEYEITLVFRGRYDDTADAFEYGDLVAASAEKLHPDIAIDVKLAEVGP